MVYQVLARKWRPQVFNDVVGQEHVLTVIKNSVLLNKLHHSYVLSGTRGIGKTTIARLFAKFLNCIVPAEYAPCDVCERCLEIKRGCFLDVIEIDAASRTKIEDTRDFLDNVYYPPSVGKFKIYLIDEIHMLSRNSFNALLKILEEPPHYVKFFLITTDQKKIPPTVLSRCVQFYLRPLSSSQIFNQLLHIFKKENIEVQPSAIKLIAQFSKGSIRDALNLSEQAIVLGKNKISYHIIQKILGIIDVEHSLFLLENLFNSDINAIMIRIDECEKLNVNWDYLLSDMLSLLQKIAVIQLSFNKEINIDDKEIFNESRLHVLSKKMTPENIQLYYQILLSGRQELSYAPNYRVGFEMIILRVHVLSNFSKKTGSQLFFNKNITKDISIIYEN